MNVIFAQVCPRLKASGRIIEDFMTRLSINERQNNSDASKVNCDAMKKLMLEVKTVGNSFE